MTWEEGIRYLAAERAESKMRGEALVSNAPPFPPRLPQPLDARMADSTAAFHDVVADASSAATTSGGSGATDEPTPAGGVGWSERASADPPRRVAAMRSSSDAPQMTAAEWVEASKALDLHGATTPRERRDLCRRMQPVDCRVRQEIAGDPVRAVVLGALAAGCAGLLLGATTSSLIDRTQEFRGHGRGATAAPARPPATRNPFSATQPRPSVRASVGRPSRAQTTNIDRFLSFLTS